MTENRHFWMMTAVAAILMVLLAIELSRRERDSAELAAYQVIISDYYQATHTNTLKAVNE